MRLQHHFLPRETVATKHVVSAQTFRFLTCLLLLPVCSIPSCQVRSYVSCKTCPGSTFSRKLSLLLPKLLIYYMPPFMLSWHLYYCINPIVLGVVSSVLDLYFVDSFNTYWNIYYVPMAEDLVVTYLYPHRIYLWGAPSRAASQGVVNKTTCISITWKLWGPTLGLGIWILNILLGWLFCTLACELKIPGGQTLYLILSLEHSSWHKNVGI